MIPYGIRNHFNDHMMSTLNKRHQEQSQQILGLENDKTDHTPYHPL